MIKGESAFWANRIGLVEGKLHWADEYLAWSVSPDDIDSVRWHIQQQDLIHRDHSFTAETAHLHLP